MEKVSIITPSFNQVDYLESTIQSVLNQTYPHIEYFIIDGGSTDGSVEIIKSYQDQLAGWISEPDQGQTDAINKGFAMASGDVIAWLNSDDTYESYAVEQAVAYLKDHPQVGLVYGDAHYIDKNGDVIGEFPAAQTSLDQLRRGYVHIPQQAAFFRKSLWEKVGPLDPNFFFAMDYDLWVRLAGLSDIHYIKRTWANFRLHQDAKTISADDRCWPEMLQVHYRDGGKWFSVMQMKYYLRKLAAPLIRYKRKKLFDKNER
jgi:glycosyltransferase involved in cell wall biosynthesis